MTVMPCAGNAIAIMDNELNTSMRKWHRLLRLLTRTAVFVFLFKSWILYFYYSKGMQTGTVSGKKTQTFAIATVVLGRFFGICRLLVYKALKKIRFQCSILTRVFRYRLSVRRFLDYTSSTLSFGCFDVVSNIGVSVGKVNKVDERP